MAEYLWVKQVNGVLRFLKGLTIAIILAVIILPGMSYFLSSKITLMVNQWIANISPYARISYEKIDLDLGGVITLRDATVDIQYGQQPNLAIQRISIRFPELFSLYRLALKDNYSQVPETLTLELQGMSLFFLESDHLAGHFVARNDLLGASLSGTCGKNLLFGPKQLSAIGYQPSTLMNLGVQYRFHDFNQSIDILFETEIQGLGFTTLGMSINNITHLGKETLRDQNQGIKQLTFSYQDDGYIDKKVQYCARQSSVSPEEYIATEISRSDRYYADIWGVIPGPSIKNAYRMLLQDPQTVSINLELQSPFPLNRQYWETEIPVVSQLYVSVNNRDIIAPELNIIPTGLKGKVDDLLAILSQPEDQEMRNDSSEAIEVKRHEQANPFPEELNQREVYVGQHLRYHPIELTALTKDELRQIRITLINGRKYEGFLNRLSEEELKIKSMQAGGEMILPVQLERISLLEVMM